MKKTVKFDDAFHFLTYYCKFPPEKLTYICGIWGFNMDTLNIVAKTRFYMDVERMMAVINYKS